MTLTDERPVAEPDATAPTLPSMSRPRMALITIAAVGLIVVILAFLVGGSGGNSSSTTGSGDVAAAGGVRNAAPAPAPADGSFGAETSTTAGSAAAPLQAVVAAPKAANGQHAPSAPNAPAVPVDAVSKVVKTGEMELSVAKGKVATTMNQLIGLATLERGYIADSHSDEGTSPSGSVTLRVPVQSFEATIDQVRQLRNVKVLSQQTAGEDVTNKYVDLQARVHSLIATRATFERILARATTIGDTLEVQSRITDVQTQIEQLQGELRVLNDQTTFGTLTVTVDENATKVVAVHHHRSGMSAAFHRSLDRFVNGIEAIVGVIGPLLLVALLAGVAWLAARPVYRRVRRQPV